MEIMKLSVLVCLLVAPLSSAFAGPASYELYYDRGRNHVQSGFYAHYLNEKPSGEVTEIEDEESVTEDLKGEAVQRMDDGGKSTSEVNPQPLHPIINNRVRTGLEKLFAIELTRYNFDEADHDISGNYREVSSFLWLLGFNEFLEPEGGVKRAGRLSGTSRMRNWDAPFPAAYSVNAVFSYDAEGHFSDLNFSRCLAGSSFEELSEKNVGQSCGRLEESWKNYYSQFRLPALPERFRHIPRIFEEAGSSRTYYLGFYPTPDQRIYVDLKPAELEKVTLLAEQKKWDELILLCETNQEGHPIYKYYLGLSHVQLGSVESAVPIWANFLEEARDLYPQFSALASITLIDWHYNIGQDAEVIATAEQFDLYRFKRKFSESKLSGVIPMTLLKYYSSLTLVNPSKVATSIRGLIRLKEDEQVQSDSNQLELVDEQLQQLLAQVSKIQ